MVAKPGKPQPKSQSPSAASTPPSTPPPLVPPQQPWHPRGPPPNHQSAGQGQRQSRPPVFTPPTPQPFAPPTGRFPECTGISLVLGDLPVPRGFLVPLGFQVLRDLVGWDRVTCVVSEAIIVISTVRVVQLHVLRVLRDPTLVLVVMIDPRVAMSVAESGATVSITQSSKLFSLRDLLPLHQSLSSWETGPRVRLWATGLHPHSSTRNPSSRGSCPRQTARRH